MADVFQKAPLVPDPDPDGRAPTHGVASKKISSSDEISDRPVRNHFGGIVFVLLGFVALVVIASAIYFFSRAHEPHPDRANPNAGSSTTSQ